MSPPSADDQRPAGPGAAGLEAIAGFRAEHWVAAADERAVAIGTLDGARVLVSAIPLAPGAGEAWARPGREGWDLRLVEIRPLAGGLAGIIEALPDGVPSSAWVRGRGANGVVPPFAVELARRVASAHAAGDVVGRLHPALVFAAEDGSLAGVAQRPLRAPVAPGPEGRTALFSTGYLAPAEVRGTAPSPADDAFRLAALAWAWRHGEPPFGVGADEVAGVMRGRPIGKPADALDRLLASAFDPDPVRRPSTAELALALAAGAAANG